MAKTYVEQIEEAANLNDINAVIQKIEKSPTLAEEKKESLLIEAQAKKNSIENQMREKRELIPEDPIHSSENQKPPAPVVHGEPPTKKVEVTVEELKEKQRNEWNGKLYGWQPLPRERGKPDRGVAQILVGLAIVFLVAGLGFSETKEATLGRQGSDSNYRWEVWSGELRPGTTKTYDIGNASNQVDSIFTEDITIEDFFKMTPVLIANLPATGLAASTDAGMVYMVYDATSITDCTVGGGTTRNLCVASAGAGAGWSNF